MINRSPKIDPSTQDFVVQNGQLVFVDGMDYILQVLTSRLKLFQGEYIFDITAGMPWYQQILIKGYNANIVRGAFQNTILGTPGIISINSMSLTFDHSARTLTVDLDAQTDVGQLVASIPIPTSP